MKQRLIGQLMIEINSRFGQINHSVTHTNDNALIPKLTPV